MGIKKPGVAYEHPNKAKKTGKSSSPMNLEPAALPMGEIRTSKLSDKVHVRIIAHYPTTGASEAFDQMCEANIAPKTAMLALLKKGIPEFEASCVKNEINKINTDKQLEPEFIETTRALSRSTFESAKKHFDPFDVLSLRALGMKIGDAVIASVTKK